MSRDEEGIGLDIDSDRDRDGPRAMEGRPGGLRRRLYRSFPAVALARRNLSRNRLRSALATLGIVIGVLAIATLGILGNVLQLSAAQSLGGFGNQAIVNPNQNVGVETLNDRDVGRIERVAAGRAEVVPVVTGGAVVEGPGGQSFGQLYGTDTPEILFTAGSGTLPERHRQGAIVGPQIATALDVQVGSTVEVEGNSYRVITILAETDTFTPIRPDQAVVLPPDEFRQDEFDQVILQADSGQAASAVAEDVRERVNARERRVTVFELSSIVSEINDFFGLLSAFLTGIGAISLVVAGVSILNIMLVTTVERREEIGVMRAVGIHRENVLRLILAEAAMLGVVGSLGGAVLTVAVVAGLALTTPVETAVAADPSNAFYLALGVGFGVVTALLSGIYPAYRAANEQPVDALRS
jgi:putative ABC transport system permease protein